MEPTNPYAASKAAAELVVRYLLQFLMLLLCLLTHALPRSYHRSFNLPVIITRSNNVYGPHQYPEKIIPKFISLLSRGRKLYISSLGLLHCFSKNDHHFLLRTRCSYIHGNGSNRRNYIFAEDVARAFDGIIHRGELGKVYSIGSDDCFSNLDVARKLLKAFGLADKEEEYLDFVEDRLFNDLRYYIDSSETKKLGWEQEVSFEDGLAKTSALFLTLARSTLD